VTVVCLTTARAGASKCWDLALKRCGSLGSYEAGAVKAFAKFIKPLSEMEWDTIRGVLVGALNAFGFAVFAKGEETKMAEYSYNVWFNISNAGVFILIHPLAYSMLFERS
jgi:hypothetical protein